MLGDINVLLRDPCNEREEELATLLVDREMVGMTAQFLT